MSRDRRNEGCVQGVKEPKKGDMEARSRSFTSSPLLKGEAACICKSWGGERRSKQRGGPEREVSVSSTTLDLNTRSLSSGGNEILEFSLSFTTVGGVPESIGSGQTGKQAPSFRNFTLRPSKFFGGW